MADGAPTELGIAAPRPGRGRGRAPEIADPGPGEVALDHEKLRVVAPELLARRRADRAVLAGKGPIGLGGVLRAPAGAVDAAGRRVADLDRRRECREGEPGVDPSAERVADDAPGREIQGDSGGLSFKRNTPWLGRQAVRKGEAASTAPRRAHRLHKLFFPKSLDRVVFHWGRLCFTIFGTTLHFEPFEHGGRSTCQLHKTE